MSKRGRPAKPEEEKLTSLHFRCSVKEADLVIRAAAKRGQTVSEFLRERNFPSPKKQKPAATQ